MRVFIGGVGYRNLRDHSFGGVVVDALACTYASPDVVIEDISYNPIAVVQRLQDEPADRPFDLAIMVGSTHQPRRKPGTLTVYRWDRALPGPDAIQAAITEAVTGIIALDNTVVIAQHFHVLPPTVVIIELEPDAHEFGDELTPAVQVALARACEYIQRLIANPSAASRIAQGRLVADRAAALGFVSARVSDVVS